jgi:putative spermidine/putrescine transport system substrate-binding protein
MKKYILTLAAAAVAAVLPVMPAGAASSKKAAKQLIVSTWGLSEDSLWSEVYEPFEKSNNLKVILDTGNAQERYTKMKADPNSKVDIIELAQKNVADGVADGAFAKVSPSDIKEFSKLIPAAQAVIKSGSGVPYTINSIGIIYDEKAAGMKITEWKDLWNPALKGKIAVPDITTTFGPAFICMAGDYKGTAVTKDKGEAAFQALAELKPNVVRTYAKASDVANLMKNGEIAAAVVGDFGVPVISKADPDAVYIVPASGTYANFNVMNISKNTKNRELAIAYLNYRLSADTELRTAKAVNDTPVNTATKIPADISKYMTVGAVAARAKMVDFTYIRPLLTSWIDRYNKLMNQ